jgi:transposase
MADLENYEDYLGNSDFIKYGVVISKLVWGKTYSQISEAFQVTSSYVSQVMRRWNEDHQFIDKRINNGGSNKKMTKRKQDYLRELIEENRGGSLREIAAELGFEYGTDLSYQTIATYLKANGYKKSLPLKVPFLSNNAIEKRMEYAERYLEDKFSNVCFTDEVMFQLSENRQLQWWNPQFEERPVFEEGHDKSKVMLWGGISRKGKTEMFYWKVSEDLTVDSFEYIECLEQTLLPKMDSLYGIGRWRLMQDNARPHTAGVTQNFLKENNIRVIGHPPYSPDLNPIELVWAYLKKRVMTKAYRNLDEVLNKVFQEWYNIPQEMIVSLIDGHIKRIQEIHSLQGKFY